MALVLQEDSGSGGIQVTFASNVSQQEVEAAVKIASDLGYLEGNVGANRYLTNVPVSVIQDAVNAQEVFDLSTQDTSQQTQLRSGDALAQQTARIEKAGVFQISDSGDVTSDFFSTSKVVGVLNTDLMTATPSPGLTLTGPVQTFFDRPDLFVTTTRATSTQPATGTFFDRLGQPTGCISSVTPTARTVMAPTRGLGTGIGTLLLVGALALAFS